MEQRSTRLSGAAGVTMALVSFSDLSPSLCCKNSISSSTSQASELYAKKSSGFELCSASSLEDSIGARYRGDVTAHTRGMSHR